MKRLEFAKEHKKWNWYKVLWTLEAKKVNIFRSVRCQVAVYTLSLLRSNYIYILFTLKLTKQIPK